MLSQKRNSFSGITYVVGAITIALTLCTLRLLLVTSAKDMGFPTAKETLRLRRRLPGKAPNSKSGSSSPEEDSCQIMQRKWDECWLVDAWNRKDGNWKLIFLCFGAVSCIVWFIGFIGNGSDAVAGLSVMCAIAFLFWNGSKMCITKINKSLDESREIKAKTGTDRYMQWFQGSASVVGLVWGATISASMGNGNMDYFFFGSAFVLGSFVFGVLSLLIRTQSIGKENSTTVNYAGAVLTSVLSTSFFAVLFIEGSGAGLIGCGAATVGIFAFWMIGSFVWKTCYNK